MVLITQRSDISAYSKNAQYLQEAAVPMSLKTVRLEYVKN